MRYVFAVYVSKVVSRSRNQKLICIRYFLDLKIQVTLVATTRLTLD
jgi:hypothetical protein